MTKYCTNDLAILGGQIAFSEKLHVGKPNIGNTQDLLGRLNDMLDRRWLSNNGVFVQELERRLKEYLNVKHCIAVCNATIGLEILAHALDLQGEVIIPSFTFIATAHALQWLNIKPVFCDIDLLTHNIDPQRVEELITSRTTGILGVHVWGRPCNIKELDRIAKKNNLKLLFDAAHAFGCSSNGTMVGSFGEAEVFSFHATKFFNSFEGGAIVTNNDDLAMKIRSMINFGFQGYDNVISLGTNGKMNEAAAAMGLTSLDAIDSFIEINHHNYTTYKRELKGIPGVHLINYDGNEKNNYQYIILEIDNKESILTRDEIDSILHAENVLSRRYFFPGCHQMEPYCSLDPNTGIRLPNTNSLVKCTLSLPNGTAVNEEDIISICQIIRFVITNGVEVRQRLTTK